MRLQPGDSDAGMGWAQESVLHITTLPQLCFSDIVMLGAVERLKFLISPAFGFLLYSPSPSVSPSRRRSQVASPVGLSSASWLQHPKEQAIPLLGTNPKELRWDSSRYLSTHVYSSIIHNSEQVDAT